MFNKGYGFLWVIRACRMSVSSVSMARKEPRKRPRSRCTQDIYHISNEHSGSAGRGIDALGSDEERREMPPYQLRYAGLDRVTKRRPFPLLADMVAASRYSSQLIGIDLVSLSLHSLLDGLSPVDRDKGPQAYTSI
jgi:hypothetical protein